MADELETDLGGDINGAEVEVTTTPVVDDSQVDALAHETTTEGGEAETKPVTPPAAAVETDPLDPQLMTRAIRAGMDYDAVRDFPNNRALARTVQNLEAVSQRASGQAEPKKNEPKLPPSLEGPVYTDQEIADREALRASMLDMHERLEKYEGREKETQASLQQQAQIDRAEWFDGKIAALGGDFAPELGTGKWNTGAFSRQQLDRRGHAFAIADYCQNFLGYDKDRAFDAGIRAVLTEKFDRKAVETVTKKMKERSQSRTFAGAGSKKDTTPSGKLSDDPELRQAWQHLQEEQGKR